MKQIEDKYIIAMNNQEQSRSNYCHFLTEMKDGND